jgi:4-hydroxybenzoate polyprenyltransferase
MRTEPLTRPHLLARLWIYQAERFPLAAHLPLIAAFAFCAVAYSARLRADTWPDLSAVIVAFVTCSGFFMQLRIADEFKDAAEDARWRPYRPVPRGLVSLRELGWCFVVIALSQCALALLVFPPLLTVLAIAWIYLAAMSFEFGVGPWLKSRPLIYLFSHMLIMPIVDFYATACDWMPAGSGHGPGALVWFLAASFANGIVIELGRKIRSADQEEEGVETYSRLWGPRCASLCWWMAIVVTAVCALLAAMSVQAMLVVSLVLGVGLCATALVALGFARHLEGHGAKRIELASAVWTILLYTSLGILP